MTGRSVRAAAAAVALVAACRPADRAVVVDSARNEADAGRAASGERADASDARNVVDAGDDRAQREVACLREHYDARVVAEATYDDGRRKTTAERIAQPDVEDIFALRYPTGAIQPVVDPEHDPGRVRLEPLFAATYGATASAVSAALVPVDFAGHKVSFHRRAAPALARVASRLDALVRNDASLGRYLRSLGGTFAARKIAGTEQTSAHAWGIAIDLDTTMSDYWRNQSGPVVWRNRIPQSIVDAFEAEGFVWGGRWFHYDTMHFEYRPELFDPRCRTP